MCGGDRIVGPLLHLSHPGSRGWSDQQENHSDRERSWEWWMNGMYGTWSGVMVCGGGMEMVNNGANSRYRSGDNI